MQLSLFSDPALPLIRDRLIAHHGRIDDERRREPIDQDRHLLRLGERLGLLPPKADFRRGHRLLNGCVPNDWGDRDCYQQHWLMKFHSQTVCRHGEPLCGKCPLTDICRYFSIHHAGGNP